MGKKKRNKTNIKQSTKSEQAATYHQRAEAKKSSVPLDMKAIMRSYAIHHSRVNKDNLTTLLADFISLFKPILKSPCKTYHFDFYVNEQRISWFYFTDFVFETFKPRDCPLFLSDPLVTEQLRLDDKPIDIKMLDSNSPASGDFFAKICDMYNETAKLFGKDKEILHAFSVLEGDKINYFFVPTHQLLSITEEDSLKISAVIPTKIIAKLPRYQSVQNSIIELCNVHRNTLAQIPWAGNANVHMQFQSEALEYPYKHTVPSLIPVAHFVNDNTKKISMISIEQYIKILEEYLDFERNHTRTLIKTVSLSQKVNFEKIVEGYNQRKTAFFDKCARYSIAENEVNDYFLNLIQFLTNAKVTYYPLRQRIENIKNRLEGCRLHGYEMAVKSFAEQCALFQSILEKSDNFDHFSNLEDMMNTISKLMPLLQATATENTIIGIGKVSVSDLQKAIQGETVTRPGDVLKTLMDEFFLFRSDLDNVKEKFTGLMKKLQTLEVIFINLEVAEKKKTSKSESSTTTFFISPKKEESIRKTSFANGAILVDDARIKVVETTHSDNSYRVFIDEQTLCKTSCSRDFLDKAKAMRFKLAGVTGQGLKYIGNSKLLVTCAPSDGVILELPLLYELKPSGFFGEQRLGLVAMPSDNNPKETLLIGLIYLPNALHQNSDIEKLKTSLKNKIFTINFASNENSQVLDLANEEQVTHQNFVCK